MCKFLTLTTLLFSANVMAQTPDELVKGAEKEFAFLSVANNVACGHHEVLIQVHKQEVKIQKSSGLFELDNEALRATKTTLKPTFTHWIEFPITVDSGKCPSEFKFIPDSSNFRVGQ